MGLQELQQEVGGELGKSPNAHGAEGGGAEVS